MLEYLLQTDLSCQGPESQAGAAPVDIRGNHAGTPFLDSGGQKPPVVAAKRFATSPGRHFAWRRGGSGGSEDNEDDAGRLFCDVVSSHTLPVATFVTIQDNDSSASEPELDFELPRTEAEVSPLPVARPA